MPANLIDHSGFHVLRPRSLAGAELRAATLELLQLVERALLAERLILAGSESDEVSAMTHTLLRSCAKHGLAGEVDDCFSVVEVEPREHREACRRAAPNVHRVLDAALRHPCDDEDDYAGFLLRPSGTKPPDFGSLADLSPRTPDSDAFLSNAFALRGWEATAAPIVLNTRLHRWLKTIVRSKPDPRDPIYSQLRTVLRWQINLELMTQMREASGVPVAAYVPALGRTRQLAGFRVALLNDSAARLSAALKVARPDISVEHELIASELDAGLTSTLPPVGLWFMSQLPPECTHDQFLDQLREARMHQHIVAIRRWQDQPHGQVSDLDLIVDELKQNHRQGSKSPWWSLVKTEFSIVPGSLIAMLAADSTGDKLLAALIASLTVKGAIELGPWAKRRLAQLSRRQLLESGVTAITAIAGQPKFDNMTTARLESLTRSILSPAATAS